MTIYSRLLFPFLLIASSFNSDVNGQQITAEGDVSIDGQQVQSNLGPTASVGEVRIGDRFLNPIASGRLTVSDGASLNGDSVAIGSDQTTGFLDARGLGTTVEFQQRIDLLSGAVSVTSGATVAGSFLRTIAVSPFAPTINISGLGSRLQLNSTSLEQGTINISDGGNFFSEFLDLRSANFPVRGVRINLTDGGQAVIRDLNLDSNVQGHHEFTIGDNSFLMVLSRLTINNNNTVSLEGGALICDQGLTLNSSGELRGYGEVIGEIQLEGSSQDDHRLTVTADQTLRTSGIRNFTGRITNFGTIDAGRATIENVSIGRYLGENSTIRAGLLINEATINLTNGRNLIETNLNNIGNFNISGGASVIFTDQVINSGVIHTSDRSTSTFLDRLSGSGSFEGEGEVTILGNFASGNSPALVSFQGDLALGAGSTTEIKLRGPLRSTAMQASSDGRFDAFDIDGTFAVDGELAIELLDGFEFEPGQEFVIADVGNEQIGQFSGLTEGALVGNFGGTDLFISYAAGDGNDVSLFTVAAPEIILGDVNQDGVVNFLDISPFIQILATGQFLEEADVNQDNAVDFLDIAPFIAILAAN